MWLLQKDGKKFHFKFDKEKFLQRLYYPNEEAVQENLFIEFKVVEGFDSKNMN